MEWLWIVVATTLIAVWLLVAAIGVVRGASRGPLEAETDDPASSDTDELPPG